MNAFTFFFASWLRGRIYACTDARARDGYAALEVGGILRFDQPSERVAAGARDFLLGQRQGGFNS